MNSYTYEYRIIKNSWGIAIDVTGRIEKTQNSSDEPYLISVGGAIEDNEKIEIEKGIGLLRSGEKITLNGYKIFVEKIDYNPCDFQIEGIKWAVSEWLAKLLNLDPPKYSVAYDKKQKKYLFNT